MDLFLVRHAIAEDDSADGSDAARALTPRGRRRFEQAVRGLGRLDVGFDRVLFSPLLRAQESAEILLELCRCESEVTLDLAAPPGLELLARLQAGGGDRVALVGHEPWLSQLAAWLVCGWRVYEDSATGCLFEMDKGGVLHLAGEPGPGSMTLVAAYPPAALRKLARR